MNQPRLAGPVDFDPQKSNEHLQVVVADFAVLTPNPLDQVTRCDYAPGRSQEALYNRELGAREIDWNFTPPDLMRLQVDPGRSSNQRR